MLGASAASSRGERRRYALSRIEDVPKWLERPGILTAYRVRFSLALSARSLLRLHNETWNVWSHLAGAVLFVYLALGDDRDEPASVHLFHAACVASLLLSAAFHLFCCRDEELHDRLLRCDLGGISALILGSYIPGLHFAFWCHPVARQVYQAVMVVAGVTGVALPHLPVRLGAKQAFYAALVAFALVPTLHWAYIAAADEPDRAAAQRERIGGVLAMLAWYALGAFFYFTRLPERAWPGRFDVWGHSHTLWHLCVVAAALQWNATLRAMGDDSAGRACPGDAAQA